MSVLRKKGERGFTLIEMLIVVAIVAVIAGIATISVSRTLKKQRVEAAANQLQGFLESAAVYARERSTGVFVWIHRDNAPGGGGAMWWYCYLIEDTNRDDVLQYVITDPTASPPGNPGADPDTYIRTDAMMLPDDITLAPLNGATNTSPPALLNQWPGPNNWPQNGVDFVMLCDPRGLPFNPAVAPATQINNPVAISLTHQEMVSGALRPGLRYDITISPLWHTNIVTVMY